MCSNERIEASLRQAMLMNNVTTDRAKKAKARTEVIDALNKSYYNLVTASLWLTCEKEMEEALNRTDKKPEQGSIVRPISAYQEPPLPPASRKIG